MRLVSDSHLVADSLCPVFMSARRPSLKELCAHAALPKSWKKQDLIDRLSRHPGGGIGGGAGAEKSYLYNSLTKTACPTEVRDRRVQPGCRQPDTRGLSDDTKLTKLLKGLAPDSSPR